MERKSSMNRDGSCPVYVYRPDGNGLWPGVFVFMDGLGIRPAILEINIFAANGYFVLLPDLYTALVRISQ